MKEENKLPTDAEILRHWLDFSVPRGMYNATKRRLVEACFGKNPTERDLYTFRNWLYGRSRIPASAKILINNLTSEISGESIFTTQAEPEAITEGVSGETSGEA